MPSAAFRWLVCVPVLAAAGCSAGTRTGNPATGGIGSDRCPGPSESAYVDLGCIPSEPPVVQTTGPCTVGTLAGPDAARYVGLQSNDAGICHVELTFATGAKAHADVQFVSMLNTLNTRGCGQVQDFLPVTESGDICLPSACTFPLAEQTCTNSDAGAD